MAIKTENQRITDLLNGTLKSIKTVIPLSHTVSSPSLATEPLMIRFGVLIGFTGHIKGKLLMIGEDKDYSYIGQALYGMPLEGEMLKSFAGELGNMIAGGISTHVAEKGHFIDITAPSIIEGHSTITGFDKAIELDIRFEDGRAITLSLLLDR